MKLDPLLQPLAELAPAWAKWLRAGGMGFAWWQMYRGTGYSFENEYGMLDAAYGPACFDENSPFAIDLRTGTIHLQQPDGTIVEVPQSEWSGMP